MIKCRKAFAGQVRESHGWGNEATTDECCQIEEQGYNIWLRAWSAATLTEKPSILDADFKESVGLMLSAVGYTEDYAKQWPKEKVSVTFKRWFDEQIVNAKLSQPAPLTSTIVNDEEIHVAFMGTNFGHTNYRKLLEASVFQKLVNYHCGHTITTIMCELGLIGITGKPTKKGIKFVREAYSHLMKESG